MLVIYIKRLSGNRGPVALAWFCLFLLGLGLVRSGAATAEQVFADDSPSVVLIKDVEGFGSGVVYDGDGTILTNYHVINTPLPLTVVAQNISGGQKNTVTLNEVEIVGVHKDYDLALIKVKLPPGVRLRQIGRSRRDAATGEECYAIGNPAGASGQSLVNSISPGIVSSQERIIENMKYIQTTAPINPGNSGGALVDKFGDLIGIVTFVLSDTQGIGFAIPVKDLKREDFVAQTQKKGDYAKADKYAKLGVEYLHRAQQLTGQAREAALAIAYLAFKYMLAEAPGEAAPHNNIGNVYFEMKEYGTAKYFYRKARELNGGVSPQYFKMEGLCEVNLGNSKVAEDLWRKGLQCKQENDVRGECAEDLAVTAFREKRYSAAAYYMKWADNLGSAASGRQQTRANVFAEASRNISDAQITYLLTKTDGFSFEDADKFIAGQAKSDAVAQSPVQPVAAPAMVSSGPGAVPTSTMKRLLDQAMVDAPEPGPEGLKKKIPENATDCQPALGGLYLVLKFPSMKKLGVFNILQSKFEKFIPLQSAESLYACGGQNMVVYDPTQKLIEIYDLTTLERTYSRISPIGGKIANLHMAPLVGDSAVVSWVEGDGEMANKYYGMLKIPTMELIKFVSDNTLGQGFRNSSNRDVVHIRLDPSGKKFLSWCTSHSPSGFLYGTIDGARITSTYDHSDSGSLGFLQDQSLIVSSSGRLLGTNGSVRFKPESAGLLFPVDQSNLVLNVKEDKVQVMDAIGHETLRSFALPFKMAALNWTKDDFTTDKLVYASTLINRAAFLDNGGQQIVLFKLADGGNPEAILDQLEGLKAGSVFTKVLTHPAGSKIRLEDAPPGAKFDPETMTLTWQIVAGTKPGTYELLLSVTEPGKDEVYERVGVRVR